MDHLQRMRANLPYIASKDGLPEMRLKAQQLCFEINSLPPVEAEKRQYLFSQLLGKTKSRFYIESPFRCDYGCNIEIGEDFFSNYNCTILDVGKVTIGDRVMFAPNVSIYTAGHPIDAKLRSSGYEYGIDVTIGDDVWIGGNVVINPGVTIGSNVVIGSGSVVTKDIPSGVIAAGNPCRVIRAITPEDANFYFKDRPFLPEYMEDV